MVSLSVHPVLILRFKIILKRIDGAVVVQINKVGKHRRIGIKDEEVFLEVQNAVLVSVISTWQDSVKVNIIGPIVIIIIIFNEGVINFIPRISFSLRFRGSFQRVGLVSVGVGTEVEIGCGVTGINVVVDTFKV